MFATDPDRSSDLEWRLTSRQEDEGAFVKFLVDDQYDQVFRLCLILSGDPLPARQAAQQTLATAAGKADHFSGYTSVQAWLYRLALETCIKRHSPPDQSGFLARYLHQELDLSIADTAYVLKIPESRVQAELEKTEIGEPGAGFAHQIAGQAVSLATLTPREMQQVQEHVLQLVHRDSRRRRLSARLQEAALVGAGLLLAVVIGRLAFASLKAPDATTVPAETDAIATQEILVYPDSQSQPGRSPERRIVYRAEAGDTLTSIAEITGVGLSRLLALNKIPPEKPLQPGQPVVIALATPALSLITPTPVTPVPPLEPLTLNSSPNTIRQRILDSHHSWNTLWAAADTIFYGPAGYVGPPRVERQQVWISQPDYSLTLSGKPDGEVEIAIQASAGLITGLDSRTGTRTRLNRGILVDYTQPIHELLLPTRMRTTFNEILEVVGEEMVAERPTIILDWFEVYPEVNGERKAPEWLQHMGRFWVDKITGVILRRQWFEADQPGLIVKEAVVTQLRYDLPLSNRIFDPSLPLPTRLDWYARSTPLEEGFDLQAFKPAAQSEREPLPKRTLPADLDPARSRLQFQWTSLNELDSSQPTRADLFAEGYYLGNVKFADPRSLSCKRSPDGKLIAFTEWFEEPLMEPDHCIGSTWKDWTLSTNRCPI
jgi:LysM domain